MQKRHNMRPVLKHSPGEPFALFREAASSRSESMRSAAGVRGLTSWLPPNRSEPALARLGFSSHTTGTRAPTSQAC